MKGWTGLPSKKFVDVDPAFGPLKEKKVSFFDISRHVEEITAAVKSDISGSKKTKVATEKAVLEFESEDLIDTEELADFSTWDAY